MPSDDEVRFNSCEGVDQALKMFSQEPDGKVLYHLSAQVSACLVMADSIGRIIAERSGEGMLERARGATEAVRKVAAHYRAIREIAQRRGLSRDWAQIEAAIRSDERARRCLEAFEFIEATEDLHDIADLLRQATAVEESKPPRNPRFN